jgi:hypothetical protein
MSLWPAMNNMKEAAVAVLCEQRLHATKRGLHMLHCRVIELQKMACMQ